LGQFQVGNRHGCGKGRPLIDLTGRTLGRWTVEARVPGRYAFTCRCECGVVRDVSSELLRSGRSASCGCYRSDRLVTHGQGRKRGERTVEYQAWSQMRTRCTNGRRATWSNYGGRGISVCAAWADSFEAFFADMGPKPTPEHSLDRINVNGNYEPGNCRWATRLEQARNRRNVKCRPS
jgi:hypothetical protein